VHHRALLQAHLRSNELLPDAITTLMSIFIVDTESGLTASLQSSLEQLYLKTWQPQIDAFASKLADQLCDHLTHASSRHIAAHLYWSPWTCTKDDTFSLSLPTQASSAIFHHLCQHATELRCAGMRPDDKVSAYNLLLY
jgi:hypothetical protein